MPRSSDAEDRIGNETLSEGGFEIRAARPDTELKVTVDEAVYAMTQVLQGKWSLVEAVNVLRDAAT